MIPDARGDIFLERASKISGWMSTVELSFLAQIAQNCKVIVEVGSYKGRSTRALADNIPHGGKVHCVDPWAAPNFSDSGHILYQTDNTTFNEFYCNLADHIENGTVTPHPMLFEEFNLDIKPDFIFLDGDHRYDSVRRDIKKALTFDPATIAGHDYDLPWPGVIKAVNERFGSVDTIGTIWFKFLR